MFADLPMPILAILLLLLVLGIIAAIAGLVLVAASPDHAGAGVIAGFAGVGTFIAASLKFIPLVLFG